MESISETFWVLLKLYHRKSKKIPLKFVFKYRQTIAHLLHTRHVENCASGCKARNVHFVRWTATSHMHFPTPMQKSSSSACKPLWHQCPTSLWKSQFQSMFYWFAHARDFTLLQIVQPGFGAHSVCCWMGTGVLSAVKRPGRGADRSAHLAPRWATLLLRDKHSLRRQGDIYCCMWSLLTGLIICLASCNDVASSSDCAEHNDGMSC